MFVVVGGIAASVLQWRSLSRVATNASRWLIASPVGWLLGASSVWVSDRWLPRIPGIVGALLYVGIVLGGGLLLGLCTLPARPRASTGAAAP